MSVIPCKQNDAFQKQIQDFAETLKTEAHRLAPQGISEKDFYQSGLFRGAIERVRGQFSATTREKREFVKHILNHMEDTGFIASWEEAAQRHRHDYTVFMPDGHVAVIALKGCLDGNNTTIFERPPHASEFIIWSVCTNQGADPRRNAWSGIHTRLSAEIISKRQAVDGVIIWDMMCGTIGRPCPKIIRDGDAKRLTAVGPFRVPPPCIYVLPRGVPDPSHQPSAHAQSLAEAPLLAAFHANFLGKDDEVNSVDIEVVSRGADLMRRTTIRRADCVQRQSEMTVIKRA